MASDSRSSLGELFDAWKEEHHDLDVYVEELCSWANQKSEKDTPPFHEALERLRRLRKRLAAHFEKEDEIGKLLAKARGRMTQEIQAVRRQADKDHLILMQRLDSLTTELEGGQARYASWKHAAYELSLFLDLLEQHNEQEAASISWLLPKQNTDGVG